MKHFRTLLIALACLIAAGPLFAGGSQQGAAQAGGPVKLTAIAVTHQLTNDITTFKWLKELQQKANVSVEWQQISADWGDKKAALFASGDIPDMIFGGAGGTDFSVYNGLFADLVPLIESSGPNIKKMFAEKPAVRVLVTQLDGKIYSLPKYNKIVNSVASLMFINKTWLDRLGLQVPSTWDELKAVLIAFRDNDANGNGDKTDEIPMDFNQLGGIFTPHYLMGSLGLPISNYGQSGYFAEDGKVKNWFFDDRFKTLMLFLRDLYAQGLINKEVVTQDYSQYQSLGRNDNKYAKVGVTFGWDRSDRFGDALGPEYITVPPLKYRADSTGRVFYSNDTYIEGANGDNWSLSARSSNKEAAVRFVDQFMDPVVSAQAWLGGISDNCLKDNGDGSYAFIMPSDPQMSPAIWAWTNSFRYAPYYIADYLKLEPEPSYAEAAIMREPYLEQLGYYNNSNIYPESFMKYSAADNQTLALNETNIGSVKERWAAWLVGQGDIEAEWKSYVQSAIDAGLNKNLEIRQKAFDAYLKAL
ncbi:MAG: extracellular solute-binding protein [Treponema sp.]|jgi:putative aldouronate transport system substrate-binding protein|nr:extracellular solute-binding protein [Treponema sp.]